MKKLTLLFAAMLGLAGQASAQQELELTPTWNCSKQTIVINDPSAPQLPATVTLQGNYAFITVTENFSSAEYTHYKFVFGEAIASSALAATCKGDDFRTSIEEGATEFSGEFSKEATITRFGIQNTGSDAVTFILNDFILYKADGTEWHPTLKTAFSWTESGAGTIASEGGEESEVWSFNQWGALGYTFAEQIVPEEGDVHRFVVTSSEPFPAGFQFKVVRGSDDGDAIYPVQFTEGETTATLELSTANIHKTEDDGIDYFTAVQIQAMQNNLTLPVDVKMTYEVKYANGMLTRETLPIKVGGSAVMEDPNPGEEMGENGLPIGVNLPGSWGGYGLWKEPFSAAEYPAFKVVLREKPTDVQFFYRTHVPDAEGGNVESTVYVPWETNEENDVEVSEDGTTLTGWFDIDALGSSDIEAIALQNTGGSAVKVVVMQVYLMNEDEEWIETPGLGSSISIWNNGSTYPVAGSYDENGNLFDAYVTFTAANDYVGAYGAPVEDGTYHVVTFYTEGALPEGLYPVVAKYTNFSWSTFQWTSEPVAYEVINKADNAVSVKILTDYSPYDFWGSQFGGLQLMYVGDAEALPLKTRFTKIVREVYEATPADYVYSVVGDMASGESFMTRGEEGIWTLALPNQQIKEVKDYAYRVRANKSDKLFTTEELTWTPEETGVYTFTFTFNSTDGTVSLEAVRTDDCTWSVTFANNGNWEKVMVRVLSNGKELTNEEATFVRHSDSLDVDLYSWSMKSKDVPTTIIFSDGNGTTTGELEYVDGTQYDYSSTTGIANVKAEINNAVIYDMQGRRVAQPQKGLYIINGKKVFLK